MTGKASIYLPFSIAFELCLIRQFQRAFKSQPEGFGVTCRPEQVMVDFPPKIISDPAIHL